MWLSRVMLLDRVHSLASEVIFPFWATTSTHREFKMSPKRISRRILEATPNGWILSGIPGIDGYNI